LGNVTNQEACSVKQASSPSVKGAVEHERSVGENTRRIRVFLPTSSVLYRLLSALSTAVEVSLFVL